ncbi:hypothetical protein CC1G_04661 [Coprinopsis cinerea okayama7|uniref:Uncharacterized protein n=1 Tax=Coprinopsis cinerea (strain Okayama-7 / 130 / ATCC MYA-4618 / FGSC 9003) TaxID=240176 RepID=A8N554_COPC7|nr:hypothetical protein CC1G_04661 [Coprinopsis cinerea okayama7\|eukprot:XP_001829972.2 hypothetical protein CC1G_04661 [Coprinopsis cinerea okayama7\
MISISRTRLDGDFVLDIKPHGAQRATAQSALTLSIPTFDHESMSISPRPVSNGASISDGEIQPWSALFQSTIWTPCKEAFPTDAVSSLHSPIDFDDSEPASMTLESDSRSAPSWLPAILDPTTLSCNFDYACLEGMDDELLHTPHLAFATSCWEAVAPLSTRTSGAGTTHTNKGRTWELDASPYRNSSLSVETSTSDSPIPVFLTPSLWSDGEEDSDSDESSYDDCWTITDGVHTVGAFSPMGKEKDIYYDDFDAVKPISLVVESRSPRSLHSHSNFSDEKSRSVGQFPTPVIRRKTSMSGRLAAFCANIPTKLTLVRPGAQVSA